MSEQTGERTVPTPEQFGLSRDVVYDSRQISGATREMMRASMAAGLEWEFFLPGDAFGWLGYAGNGANFDRFVGTMYYRIKGSTAEPPEEPAPYKRVTVQFAFSGREIGDVLTHAAECVKFCDGIPQELLADDSFRQKIRNMIEATFVGPGDGAKIPLTDATTQGSVMDG